MRVSIPCYRVKHALARLFLIGAVVFLAAVLVPNHANSQTTILLEDFESAFPEANGWTVGDANPSGTPAYWNDVDLRVFGSPPPVQGNWAGYCAGTGYGGSVSFPEYRNSMTAFMSRSIDLTAYGAATLIFLYAMPSIETCFTCTTCCDYFRVLVGGVEVFNSGDTPQTAWQEVTINLTPFVGAIRTLRLEFISDGSFTDEGVYVDDIRVTGADDPNDQIGEAVPFGSTTQTWTRAGTIDSPIDVDMWSFTVIAGQRISLDIDLPSGSTLDSYIRLFDSNGVQLGGGSNDDGVGPGEPASLESYLQYDFAIGGTYYLGVSGLRNISYDAVTGEGDTEGGTGSYALVISPGISGAIVRDGQTFPVDILRLGPSPLSINANQRTWIVIHGWNSSRTNSEGANIPRLAEAVANRRPSDQVLSLDWSEAAGSLAPCPAANAIVPVAQWTANALAGYGFSGANLNFVGHSYGSYISAEIAERISGGVDTIVGLDPALDAGCAYNPNAQVVFDANSQFAWAVHTSFWGSEFTPTTADESFVVPHDHDCFPFCSIAAHSRAAGVFTYMLENPDGGVSQLFQLDRLLSRTRGPWLTDQYSSHAGDDEGGDPGYEAVIRHMTDSDAVELITFISASTGAAATIFESDDSVPPIIAITTPTDSATYTTSTSTINVAGNASDHVGVTEVTWRNDAGSSGTATGTTSWTVNGINLTTGTNVITITARDAAGNAASDVLTVTFQPPDPIVVRIVRDGATVRLTWEATIGKTYLVQATESLTSPNWIEASDFLFASNTAMSWSEPRMRARRFYRIYQVD